MRILDVNDNELQLEDIDLELGHLEEDKVFVKHHEAIEAQTREWHYWPITYYFEDETRYLVEGEEDPHVKVDDLTKCLFSWNTLEGENPKDVRGIDVIEVEIKPEIQAAEAWDEYEEIQRYKLYTQKELEDRQYKKQQKEKQEELLATGLDRIIQLEEDLPTTEEAINENIETINQNYESLDESLVEMNITVEDLVLIMADILGGKEE